MKSCHCVSSALDNFWRGRARTEKVASRRRRKHVPSRGALGFIGWMPDDRALSQTRKGGVGREVWVGKERAGAQSSESHATKCHNGPRQPPPGSGNLWNGSTPVPNYRRGFIGWQALDCGEAAALSQKSAWAWACELTLKHQIAEIITQLPAFV